MRSHVDYDFIGLLLANHSDRRIYIIDAGGLLCAGSLEQMQISGWEVTFEVCGSEKWRRTSINMLRVLSHDVADSMMNDVADSMMAHTIESDYRDTTQIARASSLSCNDSTFENQALSNGGESMHLSWAARGATQVPLMHSLRPLSQETFTFLSSTLPLTSAASCAAPSPTSFT